MTSIALHSQIPACGRWSALFAEEKEKENDCVSVEMADCASPSFSVRMRDPLLELMDDPSFEWGIIADVETDLGMDTVLYPDFDTDMRGEEPCWDRLLHEGWDIVEVLPGYYSTRNLDDEAFEKLMTWLYATGWEVSTQNRFLNIVSCHHCNTGGQARLWTPAELEDEAGDRKPAQERYAAPKNACTKCGTHHWLSKTPCPTSGSKGLSKPGTDIGRRDGAPVPTVFCNLGSACPKPGCRYVHGNTIPRIDRPCMSVRDGRTCSKLGSCVYMHQGEKYVPGMVITRPGTK
jgi:hypothetical protein